jgi:acyl-homoserine-lactone acylase
MKNIQIIIAFLLSLNFSYSQVNPLDVEIVRDNYGVPHIYGKTDADVAYGLAWAHSEDDFKTIQEAYLAGNGLLSKHIGLKGAPVDFISQLIRSDYVVDSLIDTIDKKFMKIAEAYAQGFQQIC